jgi:hypothetical protein
MTRTKKLGMALIFTAQVFGCSTPATAPEQKAAAQVDDAVSTCEALFQREAACTDAFIPMLVDVRVKLDQPAGIAAKAHEAGGREALIAKARDEWKTDSLPESAARTCQKAAGQPAALVATARACLAAHSACDAFVACVQPLHEQMLTARK